MISVVRTFLNGEKKKETVEAPPQDVRIPIRFEELIGHGEHVRFIGRSLEKSFCRRA